MNNKFILCAAVTLLIFACSTDAIIDEQDLTESHQNNQEAITTSNTANATTTTASSTSTTNLDVKTDTSLKTNLDQSNNYTSSLNLNGGNVSNCSDFTPPRGTPQGNEENIIINYSFLLTVTEIDCVRKEYFERFPLLRMTKVQYEDPYRDSWLIKDFIGPTGIGNDTAQAVKQAIEDDERID